MEFCQACIYKGLMWETSDLINIHVFKEGECPTYEIPLGE